MFGISIGIGGISLQNKVKLDFTKQQIRIPNDMDESEVCFFVFKFWKGLQLRLIVCVSVLGNVDEAFSGCSAGIQATSLETLSFSTFIILLNLLFHSSLTPGPRTAVYRMGSFGLQGASGPLFFFFRPSPPPFSLKSEPQQPRFHWGWGELK